MKKFTVLILCILCIHAMAGCSGNDKVNDSADSNSSTESAQTDKPATQNSDTKNINPGLDEVDQSLLSQTPGIDIDLTKLSSTMVYSQVFDMTAYPDKYLGKTVRMTGPLASFRDEEKGKTYYACIIQDATACCTQGFELLFDDNLELPAADTVITVKGVLDTYEEDGCQYCVLKDAKME